MPHRRWLCGSKAATAPGTGPSSHTRYTGCPRASSFRKRTPRGGGRAGLGIGGRGGTPGGAQAGIHTPHLPPSARTGLTRPPGGYRLQVPRQPWSAVSLLGSQQTNLRVRTDVRTPVSQVARLLPVLAGWRANRLRGEAAGKRQEHLAEQKLPSSYRSSALSQTLPAEHQTGRGRS